MELGAIMGMWGEPRCIGGGGGVASMSFVFLRRGTKKAK